MELMRMWPKCFEKMVKGPKMENSSKALRRNSGKILFLPFVLGDSITGLSPFVSTAVSLSQCPGLTGKACTGGHGLLYHYLCI